MSNPQPPEGQEAETRLDYTLKAAEAIKAINALCDIHGIYQCDRTTGGTAYIAPTLPGATASLVLRSDKPYRERLDDLTAWIGDHAEAFPTTATLEAFLRTLGVEVTSNGPADAVGHTYYVAKLAQVAGCEPLMALAHHAALVEATAKYATLYIITIKREQAPSCSDGAVLRCEDQAGRVAFLTSIKMTTDACLEMARYRATMRQLDLAIEQGLPFHAPTLRFATAMVDLAPTNTAA